MKAQALQTSERQGAAKGRTAPSPAGSSLAAVAESIRASPVMQARAAATRAMFGAALETPPVQRRARPNRTGLPDKLKANVETLSGFAMDDVRVHRNSPKPAQFQAHAYAQGTEIHLGPGQEKHLPHEAWHVVQQKQGRVRPTMQLKGVGVNDDTGLEREADLMAPTLHLRQVRVTDTVQRTKWLFIDHKLVNVDKEEETRPSEGAPALVEGDTWDDVTGAITHVGDRMKKIFQNDHVADKEDHQALIAQFEDLTSSGGLLMHAVATGEEVESLGYLVEQGTPLTAIRASEFRTKLLSYIRSDLTMKTFAFRKFGLLVDWRRIWDKVGYKGGRPSIEKGYLGGRATVWPEDQQSSRYALDDAETYGESGYSMSQLGNEFHKMASEQNKLKQTKSKIGNWNEVLMHNAITAGVVGLLWIQEINEPHEAYKAMFTPDQKKRLYDPWFKKTGMKTMPIYVYRHQGSPQGEELAGAKAKLGKPGASKLELVETFQPNET